MESTRIAIQIYAKICFETTFGQKKIIEKLSEYLVSDDFSRIFVLNGYAGTGKTTLIAATVAALKEVGIKTVLLAPTGRAAKVLARYSGEKALTVHKRIYRERTNADYESKFTLDLNREQNTVFIVDEASMLSDASFDTTFGSGSLLADLVRYVRSGKNCRLILVGDSAQLPPVGYDFSPALDPDTLSRFGPVEYCTLDEVVRWLMEMGHIPSFCTACYREGRTGDRFMSLCKSGQINNCCLPNALMTLKEYLMDYATEGTRTVGERLIQAQLEHIPRERTREIVVERLAQIESGQRDFRF